MRSASNGFTGSEVGGPLSVVKTGAKMAGYSPSALLSFAAALSVNLAILNALPFPALDGGQMVFILSELATGRKVPRKLQDALTLGAFVCLLALGVSTFVADVSKLGEPIPLNSAYAQPAQPSPSTPQR